MDPFSPVGSTRKLFSQSCWLLLIDAQAERLQRTKEPNENFPSVNTSAVRVLT